MHIKGVLLALALTAPATLAMLPPTAHAADGTLYEVSEAIDMKSNGKGFKSSEATLSGKIKAGTPLCPSSVATELGTNSCWVIVHAKGGADDVSGVGPVAGTIFVLAERLNSADAPELKILSADFNGQLDLSPAFFQQMPRGTITGKYSARGEKGSIMDGYKAQGSFQGVFRLPFLNAFAMMEAVLILAAIAQRFRLELVPGQRVTPAPYITLRSEPGIRMLVVPR